MVLYKYNKKYKLLVRCEKNNEKLNKSKYLVTRCQIECKYLKLELEIAYINEIGKQIKSVYNAIKYSLDLSDDLDEELQNIFF